MAGFATDVAAGGSTMLLCSGAPVLTDDGVDVLTDSGVDVVADSGIDAVVIGIAVTFASAACVPPMPFCAGALATAVAAESVWLFTANVCGATFALASMRDFGKRLAEFRPGAGKAVTAAPPLADATEGRDASGLVT